MSAVRRRSPAPAPLVVAGRPRTPSRIAVIAFVTFAALLAMTQAASAYTWDPPGWWTQASRGQCQPWVSQDQENGSYSATVDSCRAQYSADAESECEGEAGYTTYGQAYHYSCDVRPDVSPRSGARTSLVFCAREVRRTEPDGAQQPDTGWQGRFRSYGPQGQDGKGYGMPFATLDACIAYGRRYPDLPTPRLTATMRRGAVVVRARNRPAGTRLFVALRDSGVPMQVGNVVAERSAIASTVKFAAKRVAAPGRRYYVTAYFVDPRGRRAPSRSARARVTSHG